MTKNEIMHGNCLDLLKTLPDNSVNACVTDPPYGIRFMGKKWDYELPSVEIWQEVLRVLKPGAHMLVACGTRTQHRMVVNIEDAAFEIRDVISWHYGEGFPKSRDISKAIDEEAGIQRNVTKEGQKKSALYAGKFDNANGKKRERRDIAATKEAEKWEGWGTALKPATEFWTLARKPIEENTIAANVLAYGSGALNIDACRIELSNNESIPRGSGNASKNSKFGQVSNSNGNGGNESSKGRWPANVILDEFMAAQMDEQSGELTSGKPAGKVTAAFFGKYKGSVDLTGYGDSGGASRFFYCAKASAEEREGTTHATVKPQALIQYLLKLICPIEPGRVVLEPFAGSGAHCIAAHKLGLDFYACELEEQSWKEATERPNKAKGLFV